MQYFDKPKRNLVVVGQAKFRTGEFQKNRVLSKNPHPNETLVGRISSNVENLKPRRLAAG